MSDLAQPATESEWDKRRKAMQKRLESMPKDNAIIKRAVLKMKREAGSDDVWKKFEIVDSLVSAARTEYTDGAKFEDVIKDLSDALCHVLDKGKKKEEDES